MSSKFVTQSAPIHYKKQQLRLIVVKSKILSEGSIILMGDEPLHFGRESIDGRIQLKELAVSRHHCVFYYRKDYYLADVGSTHGTKLNGRKMATAGEASMPVMLNHDDIVQIGSTVLQIHLHDGYCDQCDKNNHQIVERYNSEAPPSYIIPRRAKYRISKKDQMENERLEALSQLRSKFGLQQEVQDQELQQRHKELIKKGRKIRKLLGKKVSTRPITFVSSTTPGSINKPLDNTNKGSLMLKKMGWSGQGLGANETGIIQPIPLSTQKGKKGLGNK